MVVLGGVVMGVCFDLFLVVWQTTPQREIPPHSLSRVSAYDALGSFIVRPDRAAARRPTPMIMASLTSFPCRERRPDHGVHDQGAFEPP